MGRQACNPRKAPQGHVRSLLPVRRAMSSSRAQRWAAQRAGWKLANRGDNHFAAERRLYNQQLKELRKEWLGDDLARRRAAYVKRRDRDLKRVANHERQLAANATNTSRSAEKEQKLSEKQMERAIREERDAIQEATRKRLAAEKACLLYTSPSPRDRSLSRMPSSA